MDLRTLYNKAILGENLYQQVKQARNEFYSKYPESTPLVGKMFSLNQKEGFIKLIKNFKNLATIMKGKDQQLIQNMHLVSEIGVLFLHFNAFLSTIQMLGTPEQVKNWENLALNFQVLGAYAQTEMGHGSDVQGLLSRADYDLDTDSFILNCQDPKSGKYWPGVLGINCTHCVFQAQTFIKGQHIGVQTFVVPIRDKNNKMKLYPGVEAGDIGPKFGFQYIDNGYLYLKDYKIPRENLLMRYCQVSKDGSFKIAGKKAIKLGYGSMLNLRVILVASFCFGGLSSVHLAYHNRELAKKYCEETYHLQKKQIGIRDIYFKEDFARMTSYLISSLKLKEMYARYQKAILQDDPNILSILAEIHILSAGFKACSSWAQLQTVRQNLIYNDPIGHLNWSAQPQKLGDSIPAPTYEGDNHVLLQQTGKYLLKLFMVIQKAKKSKESLSDKEKFILGGELSFFVDCAFQRKAIDVLHSLNLNDFESVMRALEMTLFLYIQDVAQSIYTEIKSGEKAIHKILNEQYQDRIVNCSKFFIHVMNTRFCRSYLQQNSFESKTEKTLQTLLHIYLLSMVDLYKVLMFKYQLSNASKLAPIANLKYQLYTQINDKFLIDSFENPIREFQNTSSVDVFEKESQNIETYLSETLTQLANVLKQTPRL
ncbi:hypothetical protein ABPG72_012238 [Tetrahymena utriculariae]